MESVTSVGTLFTSKPAHDLINCSLTKGIYSKTSKIFRNTRLGFEINFGHNSFRE